MNDEEGVRRDAQLARDLGFIGKAAISPRHVDIINEVFTPSEAEIDTLTRFLRPSRRAADWERGLFPCTGK